MCCDKPRSMTTRYDDMHIKCVYVWPLGLCMYALVNFISVCTDFIMGSEITEQLWNALQFNVS